MSTKKTLITKLSADVTMFSDEQIEAYKAFMKASFMPGGFKGIDFEIIEENEENLFTRLLRSVHSEFLKNDEAGIRIESNGEVLQFPVNDTPTKENDERPGD